MSWDVGGDSSMVYLVIVVDLVVAGCSGCIDRSDIYFGVY